MDDRTDQALPRTEETNHFARDFTERTERAAQANINVMHMWQAGADAASKVTAQSTDQAAHALGFGDDAAEKAAGQAVVNAAALTQSASVLTDSFKQSRASGLILCVTAQSVQWIIWPPRSVADHRRILSTPRPMLSATMWKC
jgi:hypothetical protein